MGAAPLSWQDISGWSCASGITPTAFELDCLLAVDNEFLRESDKP